MTKNDYHLLSLHDKAEMLRIGGQYVEKLVWYKHHLHLYSLRDFFVEVYFNATSYKIDKIEVVEGNGLNKYLIQIALDDFVV
jgi:hypothetical protein